MTEYTKEQIKRNRQIWVEALKSGNWGQAQGALIRKEESDIGFSYCCLGVAACVVGEAVTSFQGIPGFYDSPRPGQRFVRNEWYGSLLPPSTKEALGLTEDGPFAMWRGKAVSLTMLNDGFNWSFPEIAAVIEAQDDDWDGSRVRGVEEWCHTSVPPRPILAGV